MLFAELARPWPKRRSHPDLSFSRLVDDTLTYVDSLGEPTALAGWSGGAGLALAVAAQSDAVHALAPFEPNTLRGVRIVDDAATLDGRTGIAIGRHEANWMTRQDIIIDPDTGLLIGERRVLTFPQGGMPAGTTISWTAVTTTVAQSVPGEQ